MIKVKNETTMVPSDTLPVGGTAVVLGHRYGGELLLRVPARAGESWVSLTTPGRCWTDRVVKGGLFKVLPVDVKVEVLGIAT